MSSRPATLGQLQDSGWESLPVKEEVRRNAAARIAEGRPLVDRVLGFEDTVFPQLENAAGRDLSDELTMHYGLVPRTNRGIFSINELPDLAERIQVGLLNVLEERDVQVRGYKIRLPLDVMLMASANPEDYTNRGRIITPLKDRFGSQIRTHYPLDAQLEAAVVDQEARPLTADGLNVHVPAFMGEIVAEISQQARRSPHINQRSG